MEQDETADPAAIRSFGPPAVVPGPDRLAEVSRFLSWLATDGKVSASTQNQALGALLFLYRDVLEVDLPWLDDLVRAKRPRRLPAVLDRAEVRTVLDTDLRNGAGWVELPDALAKKYPSAGREWPWQWVFPATRSYTDQGTGQQRRHHLHESVLQRAIHDAVRAARLSKRARRKIGTRLHR